MISMVAQPMFWAMLSSVGATEPRRPNSPRSDTMAGAPVVAPKIAEPPSSSAPIMQPTTTAAMASATEPVVRAITAPVSGPNRLMPRLAHIASWSTKRSGRGGSVVSWSGASAAGSRLRRGLAVRMDFDVMDMAIDSLRRHYPVRFGRSVDQPASADQHPTLSAHHVV